MFATYSLGRALGLPTASAFKTPQEAVNFINQFIAWMVESEASVNRWHNAILHQVMLGVARCADVEQFNSEAIRLFELQSLFLEKLRAAGMSEVLRKAGAPNLPADPPFPPLFAHDAYVRYDPQNGREYIQAKLSCLANGLVDPNGLKLPSAGPRVCPTNGDNPRATLGGAAALCLAGPWVFFGCTLGAVIAIGGAHLLLGDAKRIIDSFTGADLAALQNAMQTILGQQEAQRQDALNKCFDLALRDLPPNQNTAETRLQLMAQCRGAVKDTKAEAPSRPLPLIGWLVIGAVVVGGTIAGVHYVRKRRTA